MKALGLLTTLTLLTCETWALPYSINTDPTVTLATTESVIPTPLITTSAPQTTIALAKRTSSTESVTAQPIMTLPPSMLEDLTTTFVGRCDYSFCNQGTKVCFYWAGVTSWDVSRGPLPGEIPTMLGPCDNGTAAATATA
ncbi:hypothetical protein F4805DRAFT_369262 [Annulohypoxylon moriforme]|nr:hypothetical protein F4805DRAFT_369262 [Annulohypoxylon moriforme]